MFECFSGCIILALALALLPLFLTYKDPSDYIGPTLTMDAPALMERSVLIHKADNIGEV